MTLTLDLTTEQEMRLRLAAVAGGMELSELVEKLVTEHLHPPGGVTRYLTDADSHRAEAIWADYQTKHDVSHLLGEAAGIDPDTGRIWFGESIVDIRHQLDAEALAIPLHFVRVGSSTYYRKGGRR